VLVFSLGGLALGGVSTANATSFAPYVTYSPPGLISPSSQALAVGDINGDRRADILLVAADDYVTMSLFVYRQNPDGSLAAPTKHAFTVASWSNHTLAIADFNHDGRLDVIASDGFHAPDVFLQTEGGTLSPALPCAAPGLGETLVSDLDGDGRADLVGFNNFPNPGIVKLMYQQPDSGFVAAEFALAGTGVFDSFDVGDVTGDGRPDLVFMQATGGQWAGGPNILVYAQEPDGTFSGPAGYVTVLDGGARDSTQRGRSYAFSIGDVNGDGRGDVVSTTLTPDGFFLSVLTQNTTGGLDPVQNHPLAAIFPTEVKVGDVNGDGRDDVVVNGTDSKAIAVFLQQTGGVLGAATAYATPDASNGTSRQGIGLADVSGDGRTDLILVDINYGITVLRQASGPDVSVALTATPDPVTLGGDLSYSIAVTNVGAESAENVSVTGALPSDVGLVSASPDCRASGGSFQCALGRIDAGGLRQSKLVVRPTVAGSLTISANATTTTPEANLANNAAQLTTSVIVSNRPPVAHAGPDRTVEGDRLVQLDGSASRDPDGRIVAARWKQLSGPPVALSNGNSLVATFRTPPSQQRPCASLVFELTVTDDRGAQGVDRVTISVRR
jgi:uncharacterized repeat protein (TIGR01451 family)